MRDFDYDDDGCNGNGSTKCDQEFLIEFNQKKRERKRKPNGGRALIDVFCFDWATESITTPTVTVTIITHCPISKPT